jgi:hypothetical protein
MESGIVENIKYACFGIVGGVILTALIGFKGFAWETAGSAKEMSENMVKEIVTPYVAKECASKFKADPKFAENLEALKAEDDYKRRSFLQDKGDWIPESDIISKYEVSSKCVEELKDVL